ncbi:hypothetical protein MNBD_IGNAVI01-1300 [hydrothermal vent metagenome]|uniref:histidine kinase n=1 Tax=hydrothermal vent metagenome TaxID=652676 RepID=A0A3B1BYU4_9ZZZZ
MQLKAIEKKFRSVGFSESVNFFDDENRNLLITPLQVIASLVIIVGIFSLIFEVKYFADFTLDIYFGRVIATIIGFCVLALTYTSIGKKYPVFLIHLLLLTIIGSFASIILLVPKSIFVNSQLLALIIFTAALFLSWDIRNQIILAIYYNVLFAISILLNDSSIYFLPNFYTTFVFVLFISIMSIVATTVNYKLRQRLVNQTTEAQEYLEYATEGIFKVDMDYHFKGVNSSFVQLLKFPTKKEMYQTTTLKELFKSPSLFEEFEVLIKNNSLVIDYETKFRNFEGNIIDVMINAKIRKNRKGQEQFIEGSIYDITNRKEAEEKIKEYNRELEKLNNNKDKFFSIVAHDLMTPFTALLGYSEILIGEYKELDRATIGKFASDINTVAGKAHGLLENLLNWTRIQTDRVIFNPVEFNLHPIVEDIFHFNSENAKVKSITLVNNVELTELVYADVNMLSTVLRNLISNSIKFTGENGRISVATEVINGTMEVSVIDNGIGMSSIDVNRLFDENFQHSGTGTHNEKGTGLGLILCKEFVEKHGGTIRAESRLGEGTRIFFTIGTKGLIDQE